jgi:hypothetical protein
VFYKSDPEKRAFVAVSFISSIYCDSAECTQRSWSTEEDDDFEGSGPLDRPLLLGEVGLR